MPVYACNHCKTEKAEAEFPFRKRNERGGRLYRYGWCRACVQEKDRSRAKTEHHKAQRRAWYHRDPRKTMALNARQNAELKGVPFAIAAEDIQIPAHCPALGLELKTSEHLRSDSSPSIDRVIPERGYVPGNIRVISWRANRIKSDATADELRRIAEYIEKS